MSNTTTVNNVKIRSRIDTEANWTTENPILLEGEIGISSDKNGMFKVGDGTSTWLQLNYSDARNASTAGSAGYATSALNDNAGQQIDATYISDVSLNGTTLSVTKGAGDSAVTSTYTTQDTNTTYSNMTGATNVAAGTSGLVPAPGAGDQNLFLKGDGTWGNPASASYGEMTGATAESDGTSGLVPGPTSAERNKYLKGDGTWGTPTDTTYSIFTAAAIDAAGTSGLVPAPAASATNKYLSNRGTWDTINQNNMTGATSNTAGAAGFVPAPTTSDTGKYLKGDGTWDTPPNTTYGQADGSTAGLMKLYTNTGNNTDGTMTQDAITIALGTKAASSHTHNSADINSLDASKLTGTIDVARLPATALERCIVVANDTARFSLDQDDVQLGDTVKVTATGLMYFVVDTDNLDSEAGYEPYTSSTAWSNISNKPSTFTPEAHSHIISDITDLTTALNGKAASSHNHSASDINSGTLDVARLPSSGVTAGTYKSVTVDAYGRVTSGSNPTTLAGYGITDAAASSHSHTFAELTSTPTTLAGYGITDAASSTHTHSYLPLAGGTLTGNLTIKGSTSNSNTYDSANPKLTFMNTDEDEYVSLIYTNYNDVAAPASVTLIGNQGGEFFIAPNIRATGTIYENGSSLANKYQAKGNYAGSSTDGGAASTALKWDSAIKLEGLSVDGSADRNSYAVCNSLASSQTKIADCAGFNLVNGACITIKFTNTNTANNPLLNVNGTGAKGVYYRDTAIDPGVLGAGRTYTFRYNSTSDKYEMVGDVNTDTTANNAVTQTNSDSSNASYRILMSVTADDTTRTEGARKDPDLTYNPYSNTLYVSNINGNLDAGTFDFGEETGPSA